MESTEITEDLGLTFKAPDAKERIFLVDVENQPGMLQTVLQENSPDSARIYIFYGCRPPHVSIEVIAAISPYVKQDRCTFISTKSNEKNAADFLLSFTAGEICRTNTPQQVDIILVSKDSGFQSIALLMRSRGFLVSVMNIVGSTVVEATELLSVPDLLPTVVSCLRRWAGKGKGFPSDPLLFRNVLLNSCSVPSYVDVKQVYDALEKEGYVSLDPDGLVKVQLVESVPDLPSYSSSNDDDIAPTHRVQFDDAIQYASYTFGEDADDGLVNRYGQRRLHKRRPLRVK